MSVFISFRGQGCPRHKPIHRSFSVQSSNEFSYLQTSASSEALSTLYAGIRGFFVFISLTSQEPALLRETLLYQLGKSLEIRTGMPSLAHPGRERKSRICHLQRNPSNLVSHTASSRERELRKTAGSVTSTPFRAGSISRITAIRFDLPRPESKNPKIARSVTFSLPLPQENVHLCTSMHKGSLLFRQSRPPGIAFRLTGRQQKPKNRPICHYTHACPTPNGFVFSICSSPFICGWRSKPLLRPFRSQFKYLSRMALDRHRKVSYPAYRTRSVL
jgi:hypothetical protein